MKKLNKKYADLMRQAQQATGRKEATKNSTFTIMEGLDEAAKLRRAMRM